MQYPRVSDKDVKDPRLLRDYINVLREQNYQLLEKMGALEQASRTWGQGGGGLTAQERQLLRSLSIGSTENPVAAQRPVVPTVDSLPPVNSATPGEMVKLSSDGIVYIFDGPTHSWQDIGAAVPSNMMTTDTVQNITGVKTMTTPVLSIPVIADFTSAQHDHLDADDGGQISALALSDYSSGGVAFAAGDFTAQAGAWTVDAADVLTHHFTRVGGLMAYHFYINNTDVSAAAVYLAIALPNGWTASGAYGGTYWYKDAGGAWAVGLWGTASGGSTLLLFKDPAGTAWTITAADNTTVRGVAILRIA
jgi:hypothetical protein